MARTISVALCRSLRSCPLLLVFVAIAYAQQSPLDRAFIDACIGGDHEKVAELLKGGANPNTERSGGLTVLHWAAKGGHTKVMRLLIDAGANVNAKDERGTFTPLVEAASSREPQAVKMLLDAGAKPNGADLAMACMHARTETINLLLDAGVSPDAGIVSAAQNRQLATVQLLLDKGANVNFKSRREYTALHTAASQGGLPIVQLLLKAGADPNALNENGESPLHAAVSGDADIERVKLLVNAGARLDVASKEGITPVRLAGMRGQKAIHDWLLATNGGKEPVPKPAATQPATQTDKSIPQLLDEFASNNYELRRQAEQKLVLWGKAILPDIFKRIEDGAKPDLYFQLFAALGPEADGAIAYLKSKFTDKQYVLFAMMTLARMKPGALDELTEIEKQQAADALVASITSPAPNETTAYSVNMLVAIGKPAATHIERLLDHDNPEIRRFVAGSLERAPFSTESIQARLLDLARSDADLHVRLAATDALRSFGKATPEMRDAFLAIIKAVPSQARLDFDSPEFKKARDLHQLAEHAARALSRYGPAIIDDLIPLLSPMDSLSRLPAITTLVEIGEPGIPRLIELLAHQDRAVATSAGVALNRMHGKAAPALAAALQTDNDQVVDQASNALWWIGGGAKSALPALYKVAGADKRSDLARLAAARAALKIDLHQSKQSTEIRSVVPLLARILETGGFRQQGWAAEVARDLGPIAREALPALRKRLDLPAEGTDTEGLVPEYVSRQASEAIKAIEAEPSPSK